MRYILPATLFWGNVGVLPGSKVEVRAIHHLHASVLVGGWWWMVGGWMVGISSQCLQAMERHGQFIVTVDHRQPVWLQAPKSLYCKSCLCYYCLNIPYWSICHVNMKIPLYKKQRYVYLIYLKKIFFFFLLFFSMTIYFGLFMLFLRVANFLYTVDAQWNNLFRCKMFTSQWLWHETVAEVSEIIEKKKWNQQLTWKQDLKNNWWQSHLEFLIH